MLNPRTIGPEEINYRSLVIGGPNNANHADIAIYRGDSFICGAAIHAGIINNEDGGCGLLSRVGEKSSFPGSERNGISSIAFNSSFPLSFTLSAPEPSAGTHQLQCKDPRWRLLSLSIFFSSLLSIVTTSAALFFGITFTGIYFHVALVSDPPDFPDFDSVISSAFERFVPAVFVAHFIYRYAVRTSLRGLTAQYEKTVFWLGACWVGALSNYTLDQVPIQRLTPHDLRQQPGAVPALIFIVLLLVVVFINQAYSFRTEGRLPKYLAMYAIIALCISLLMAIPRLKLRIHHYILALLLLPGTALQTRSSLVYQGLLVGLFINGVARWGFASILQTAAALLEDGKLGSLLPQITTPVIVANTITFTWSAINVQYDGLSVLVNDVERFRWFRDRNTKSEFTWTRHREGDPEYFRFGFVEYSRVGGTVVADYTKPGTWTADGNWIHMQPGPS